METENKVLDSEILELLNSDLFWQEKKEINRSLLKTVGFSEEKISVFEETIGGFVREKDLVSLRNHAFAFRKKFEETNEIDFLLEEAFIWYRLFFLYEDTLQNQVVKDCFLEKTKEVLSSSKEETKEILLFRFHVLLDEVGRLIENHHFIESQEKLEELSSIVEALALTQEFPKEKLSSSLISMFFLNKFVVESELENTNVIKNIKENASFLVEKDKIDFILELSKFLSKEEAFSLLEKVWKNSSVVQEEKNKVVDSISTITEGVIEEDDFLLNYLKKNSLDLETKLYFLLEYLRRFETLENEKYEILKKEFLEKCEKYEKGHELKATLLESEAEKIGDLKSKKEKLEEAKLAYENEYYHVALVELKKLELEIKRSDISKEEQSNLQIKFINILEEIQKHIPQDIFDEIVTRRHNQIKELDEFDEKKMGNLAQCWESKLYSKVQINPLNGVPEFFLRIENIAKDLFDNILQAWEVSQIYMNSRLAEEIYKKLKDQKETGYSNKAKILKEALNLKEVLIFEKSNASLVPPFLRGAYEESKNQNKVVRKRKILSVNRETENSEMIFDGYDEIVCIPDLEGNVIILLDEKSIPEASIQGVIISTKKHFVENTLLLPDVIAKSEKKIYKSAIIEDISEDSRLVILPGVKTPCLLSQAIPQQNLIQFVKGRQWYEMLRLMLLSQKGRHAITSIFQKNGKSLEYSEIIASSLIQTTDQIKNWLTFSDFFSDSNYWKPSSEIMNKENVLKFLQSGSGFEIDESKLKDNPKTITEFERNVIASLPYNSVAEEIRYATSNDNTGRGLLKDLLNSRKQMAQEKVKMGIEITFGITDEEVFFLLMKALKEIDPTLEYFMLTSSLCIGNDKKETCKIIYNNKNIAKTMNESSISDILRIMIKMRH